MNSNTFPLISIIIPSRNEAEDIGTTLQCILSMEYEPKEILVIDDSSDNTPAIVQNYSNFGVKLVHRKTNDNGCCGARNLGMKMAQGEIIVLMNADVRPSSDFLTRLIRHYKDGADYVIVRSKALNVDNPWGKLVAAKENSHTEILETDEWSEGFSCTRTSAQEVGYIPGDFPILFCRDWRFGKLLNSVGFIKHVDKNLEIFHIVPDRIADFWRERIWRGSFSAPSFYYFRKQDVFLIGFRELLKSLRTIILLMLVLPKLVEAIKLAKFSPNGFKDIGSLYFAIYVETIATTIGYYKGFFGLLILKYRRSIS